MKLNIGVQFIPTTDENKPIIDYKQKTCILMNFIIRILRYSTPTCSFVGSFETTCRIIIAEFGNYEIHSYESIINKKQIGSQFEYNQFTRDYFADPKNKRNKREDAIKAWNDIKALPGSNTYKG